MREIYHSFPNHWHTAHHWANVSSSPFASMKGNHTDGHVSLFAILATIMFVIVRKNRRKRHAEEAAKHRDIDDGVELEFAVSRQKQGPYGHEQQTGSGPDLEDRFQAPPPKY